MNETISVDYTSDIDLNIIKVELESGFLNGPENREDLRDYKSMRSILREAPVTMGDSPGSFYFENADNNRAYFEDYVAADMVAGNGRQVTVYYYERFVVNMTAIRFGQA